MLPRPVGIEKAPNVQEERAAGEKLKLTEELAERDRAPCLVSQVCSCSDQKLPEVAKSLELASSEAEDLGACCDTQAAVRCRGRVVRVALLLVPDGPTWRHVRCCEDAGQVGQSNGLVSEKDSEPRTAHQDRLHAWL